MGALRYNTYLIGIANDESWVNAVTVRPDNPALKVKGWNPEYPNLLGSPETVKGKTFLYTQSSSQHFRHVRIPEGPRPHGKDVVMQNMDPAQVLAAFDAGIGDFCGHLAHVALHRHGTGQQAHLSARRRERGPHAHPRGRQGLL